MQKLIAKYGAAAHLAILAVAPLFLFPFFGDATQATVILWLSLPACVWILLEPSLRQGESLHVARGRVVTEILHDALFWTSLLLVVFTGIRALNGGIGLAYDAETSKWYVHEAWWSIFPGSVGTAGYLPFSVSVAAMVLLQGCRHSLGRSARMFFLLVSSTLAGVAAGIAIALVPHGNERVIEAANVLSKSHSYVGVAFGLHLLSAIVALFAIFERRWNSMVLLAILAMGGASAGVFVFAPPLFACAFGLAAFLIFIVAFVFACRVLEGSGKFKYLVVSGVSLALGGLYVTAILPPQLMDGKIAPFLAQSLFADDFFKVREILSVAAFKTWVRHLWIGTGLASFPLDFRFLVQASDWVHVKNGVTAVANGWLMVLTERGIVGLVALLLPCGFLLFTYFRYAVASFAAHVNLHPICFLGPLALLLLAATGVVDCSFLRADVLMATGTLLAVSAKGFRG